MQEIKEQRLTGERALFRSKDLSIEYSIFKGEQRYFAEEHILSVEVSIMVLS